MKPPNIIFILIDDMGWRDLTCCGSTFYETPNIDRLAREGMRFTDAYASCPVCSPTRASVITGQYPATVGITDWIDSGGKLHPCRGRLIDVPYLKQLAPFPHSLARVLRGAGYATWHVGKWHLGGEGFHPENHGFEINIGGCYAGAPGKGGYFSPWSIPALQHAEVPEGTYLTDYLSDQAVKLVRESGDRPFFLNLWHYCVHTPIQAKAEKIAKYEAKIKALGLDKVETIREGEAFPCEHKKHLRVQRRLIQSDAVYAAMIESLDEGVGRLLKAVRDAGKEDNTLIVFTSDNGGLATAEGSPTCNLPLAEGKGWMYEGGTREPLLARWPSVIAPGSTCPVPVTTPDFYPTFLELAGAAPARDYQVDGTSLLPLLNGKTERWERDAIFWHYPHYGNQGGTPGSSVRMGDYKLIEFFEDGRRELYNLKDDPGEQNDLARAMPQLVRTMQERLTAWQQQVEARIPQPNPDWTPRP